MTPNEFATLWKDVKLRLPGPAVWIAKQPTEGDDVTQADILGLWQTKLADIALEDALAVVEALYEEEIPEPKSWSRFPMIIAREARRLARDRGDVGPDDAPKPKFVDGEQVYKCSLCRDDGRVTVIHRETQKRFLDDPASFDLKTMHGRIVMGRSHYECVVACRCRMGDRRVKQGTRRIDDSWCLASLAPEQIHAWLVKFREWWLERNQSQGELEF
jgi:hypothetical protein